jgi:hypothetical protein
MMIEGFRAGRQAARPRMDASRHQRDPQREQAADQGQGRQRKFEQDVQGKPDFVHVISPQTRPFATAM